MTSHGQYHCQVCRVDGFTRMEAALRSILFLCLSTRVLDATDQSRPNIVIFLADDLGIGDIGCYGNKTLDTPNIDSLARDGMKLTQHLAADSMCTPSRSAFLTGRYTKRYGMDSGVQRVLWFLPSITGLPPREVTFAELAKDVGYRTAIIGKWHQGVYDVFGRPVYHPLNQGFHYYHGVPFTLVVDFDGTGDKMLLRFYPNTDRYLFSLSGVSLPTLLVLLWTGVIQKRGFVTLTFLLLIVVAYCYVSVHGYRFLNSVLMEDYKTIEMPVRLVGLTKRFAEEGSRFIRKQHHEGSPFLLFMSWGHVHTPQVSSKQFAGKTKHGPYGDAVEEMDWGVGKVLNTLDELGIVNNTLVYFTSDHGADLTDYTKDGRLVGGYNGHFKGGKINGGVEGGIRVPGLFRWPGRIAPGTERDAVTSLMDIFPLVSHVTGSDGPRDREIDGKNIVPLLTGSTNESAHEFLFHYCDGEIHAVRYMPKGSSRVWKVAYRFPNFTHPTSAWCHGGRHMCICEDSLYQMPPLLFDIMSDPEENHPIPFDSYGEIAYILTIVDRAKKEHEDGITHVDSQLTIPKLMWYPHLIQCCNFPFCACKDEKYSDEELE